MNCREKLYFDEKLTTEDLRKQEEEKKKKEKEDPIGEAWDAMVDAIKGKGAPLNLNVVLTDTKIILKNKEKFDLEKVDIGLNRVGDGGFSAARFHLYISRMKSDEQKEFDLSDFADKLGNKLNKNETKILNIWITCHRNDDKPFYQYFKDLKYS